MINTGNFDTKSKANAQKYKKAAQGVVTPVTPKYGMTIKGCKVGLPVKGVSNGSVGS